MSAVEIELLKTQVAVFTASANHALESAQSLRDEITDSMSESERITMEYEIGYRDGKWRAFSETADALTKVIVALGS